MLQPFTRLDTARGGSGTGLGLAIVDRIAGMHGGRVRLLPRSGGGLRARVELPIDDLSGDWGDRATSAEAPGCRNRQRHKVATALLPSRARQGWMLHRLTRIVVIRSRVESTRATAKMTSRAR
jgi:hypothetical protein